MTEDRSAHAPDCRYGVSASVKGETDRALMIAALLVYGSSLRVEAHELSRLPATDDTTARIEHKTGRADRCSELIIELESGRLG